MDDENGEIEDPNLMLVEDEYRKNPILRPLINLGMQERDQIHHKNLPRASILVLLFRFNDEDLKTNDWYVLFTQRPLHLKSHPGEVCFPGGRQEDSDTGDDIKTATRETMEEVGIPEHDIIPLARMTTIESVGGLCVTPILAIWKNPLNNASDLNICEDEVEAAFYVPLSFFWNEMNCVDKQEIQWKGGTFTMRTYYWEDTDKTIGRQKKMKPKNEENRIFKIWGLTAHVIYEMAQICIPDKINGTVSSDHKDEYRKESASTM